MLFNTYTFVLFLAAVLALHAATPPRHRNLLLLFASYAFYSAWDWRFSFLLAASTCIDFICGRKIHAADTPRRARRYVCVSLAANLGILGFFKYFDFFASSTTHLLQAFGLQAGFTTLNIILPVGISFYTFQTLSYSIDIYRGAAKPHPSFRDFALYVAYFPQLVAGPIERATRLLPQIASHRTATRENVLSGGLLVLQGYAKKVLVSDNIAGFVDRVFTGAGDVGSIELWAGLVFFSIQIYFDFSGYTDIARGVSRWFGIDLMENFRQPYFSRNIAEFWQRWHVSLSTWLRDYLYIPLGGNRHGSARMYRNLMITMLLGGLWHGASWNFVLWGAMHGGYLCAYKMYSRRRPRPRGDGPMAVLSCIGVYGLVLLTWIPFRAPDIHSAWLFVVGMFRWTGAVHLQDVAMIFLGLALVVALDAPARIPALMRWLRRLPAAVRYTFMLFVACAVLVSMYGRADSPAPFIYFQF